MMIDQVLKADPENFKAWTRKAANHIKLGEVDEARKTLNKCEEYAENLEDKALMTSLYRDLAL